MDTIEDKLSLLISTKIAIRQKIQEMGVSSLTSETPFADYPDYIALIADLPETTTDQDLLQMCDVVELIGSNKYVDKVYTNEEIQEVKDLLDIILTEGDLVNE